MVVKKSDRTYILCCVFAAMTSLFYCSIRWFGIKLPRYYPTEHTWKWFKTEGVSSQGWYSMQTFAFVCGGIVTIIVYLLLKRAADNERDLEPRHAKYLGAVTTIIMIFALTYITWYEFSKWGVFEAMGL